MTHQADDQLRQAWETTVVGPAPTERLLLEGRAMQTTKRRRTVLLGFGGAVAVAASSIVALQLLSTSEKAGPSTRDDVEFRLYVTTGAGLPVTVSDLKPTLALSQSGSSDAALEPTGPMSADGGVSWDGVADGDYRLDLTLEGIKDACSAAARVKGDTLAVLRISPSGGCELVSVDPSQTIVPWVQNAESVAAAQDSLETAGFSVNVEYLTCDVGFCKDGVVGTVPEAFSVVARGATITLQAR